MAENFSFLDIWHNFWVNVCVKSNSSRSGGFHDSASAMVNLTPILRPLPPWILVERNALESISRKNVEELLELLWFLIDPSTPGLSMFTSISRGRARFRPTYICTSCLASILPHPDHQPRQALTCQTFSTTSNCRDGGNDASTAATRKKTRRRSGSRPRRAQRSAKEMPISHSRDELSALKESLLAEEPSESPAKKSKSNRSAPVSDSKDELSALKESLVEEASASKKSKSKPQRKKKTADIVKSVKSANVGQESPSPKGKAGKTKKRKAAIYPTKSTSDTSDGTTHSGEPLEICRTKSKSNPSRRTIATEAQRRKVEAALLGAKIKQAAVLGKKITGHIHAIGENETREALVRIIEDGKLSKGDALTAVQKLSTRLPGSVKKARAENGLGRNSPLVRRHLSRPSPEVAPVGLRIRRIQGVPPPAPVRMLRTGLSDVEYHNQLSGGFKTLRSAMKDGPVKMRLSRSRRSSLTRPAPGTGRSSAAENIPRGPLEGKGKDFVIETLDASDLELTPISKAQPPVPTLWYGLERVLFNPGVYQLQDPRSRVFNFDPYLQTIMPVSEFDFTALKQYITSSRDETLLATAREEQKKYTGSTSSTTSALAHFHFLLSQWRPVNTEMLSQNFPVQFNTFTALQRGPSAVFLKWKDGVYAIDADKQFDTANILSTLGKSMEKLLTLPTEDFERYRKQNSNKIPVEEREADEAFHYTTMGDFLLRSQLDAYDPRLPGTGMFDLKTRAVVSIRMDTSTYEQGMDYEIRGRFGEWESYEREYYDMIRAAFLKYSLQVRMGRMDGIFVAFHNTQRIFGFQYISLPEMDLALHGTEDTTTGDNEFKMSLELLNKALDRATAKYPEKSLRLHFETRSADVPFMYIFAEPMEDGQIVEIQETNKDVVEEFERRVLGLGHDVEEEQLSEEEMKAAEWASMRAKVQEEVERDELDIEEARTIVESLIDESTVYESGSMSTEEKEKMISELLESAAFSKDEDEDDITSREEGGDGEDGIEGASADSEGDEMDEDGEDEEEGDESDENGEDGNEDEETQEEDEETVEEDGEEVEESDNPEQAEETELMDDSPTENAKEDVEETVKDGTSELTKDIKDTESVDPDSPELVENKDLAPNDTSIESDTQEPAEATTYSDGNEPYSPAQSGQAERQDRTEVSAWTLTIRNKVNGEYVDRPRNLTREDQWTIEYALEDVPEQNRAQRLYQACKVRRRKALSSAKRDDADPWNDRYLGYLRELSRKGKEWREHQNKVDSREPVKVLDWDKVKDDTDQSVWSKQQEKADEAE